MEQLTAEEIRSTADNWRRALEHLATIEAEDRRTLEAITAPDTWQAEMIAEIEAQPWPPIAAEWHLEAEAWPELDTWPPINQGGG